MRFIFICVAALWLAGCANSSIGLPGLSGGSVPKPKTIVVTDFVFGSEVVAVDRGFTARLERKVGSFPTFERKQRTAERVNDEIVASIVATLREAGLEAQPGSEDGLSLNDDAVVVGGRLRAADPATAKKDQTGFGAGRGGVVADMSVSHFSSNGKKQLASFTTEGQSGGRAKPNAKTNAKPNAKLAAAQNAEIAAALAASDAAKEKLSGDVEAQARRLGRAAGDKIVSFAREQGWLAKDDAGDAASDEKPVKLPAAKPQKKTGDKPAV